MPTTKDSKLPEINYTFSDRSLDGEWAPWDNIPPPSSKDTMNLLGYWSKLQNEKSQSQLETPEWKALEASYLSHLKWRFDYPRKIATQQLIFSWVMTSLVFILVITGLIFSLIQLNYALTVGSVEQLKSVVNFEAVGKLSISSSVIGALVLVVSLVFYYLYLRYVFSVKQNKPIHLSLVGTDAPRLFGKPKLATLPAKRIQNRKKQSDA